MFIEFDSSLDQVNVSVYSSPSQGLDRYYEITNTIQKRDSNPVANFTLVDRLGRLLFKPCSFIVGEGGYPLKFLPT